MKKTAVILCILAALALILPHFLRLASSQEDNSQVTVPASFYSDVRESLAKLVAQNDKMQVGAIQQKLDQILANQAQIIQELDVIKVRATIRQ